MLHFDVPHNAKALLYDDAVSQLTQWCQEIDLKAINSIKFHTNTWGLSSCNFFAEAIIANMPKLKYLDFSDTVKFRHRSDLCMGTQAMLLAANEKAIYSLNLADNLLEDDGARAYSAFLEANKSLKVLNVNNCSLACKSCIMMDKAITNNPSLKLTHLYLADNNIGKEGMDSLADTIEKMNSLRVLDISGNMKEEVKDGLAKVMAVIAKQRQIEHVDVSRNKCSGALKGI